MVGRYRRADLQPTELIATKFRALAQRSKGRDLNDLDVARTQLALDDDRLAASAAHYLFHAGISPTEFRQRLADHLTNPEFVADVTAFLIDTTQARDPVHTAYELTLWSDQHLDLAHARLAAIETPSRRRHTAIHAIEDRLASTHRQCPVHARHHGAWARCTETLTLGACPTHGVVG